MKQMTSGWLNLLGFVTALFGVIVMIPEISFLGFMMSLSSLFLRKLENIEKLLKGKKI